MKIVNLGRRPCAQTAEAIAARKVLPLEESIQCHTLGMAFAEGLKLGIY